MKTATETLAVPWWWWPVGLFIFAPVTWGIGLWFSDAAAWVGLALGVVLVAAALVAYGRVRVGATDAGLRAGANLLDWSAVGPATALDEAETAAILRADANASALVVTRGYLPRAVKVDVADPSDPHPYWLVGSRDPARLAHDINDRRTA